MEEVHKEAFELYTRKNQDYGKAYEKFGTIGLLIRITDKISRAISITEKNVQLVDDESLRDTLIDLHNYAAMAVMEMDTKKNKK